MIAVISKEFMQAAAFRDLCESDKVTYLAIVCEAKPDRSVYFTGKMAEDYGIEQHTFYHAKNRLIKNGLLRKNEDGLNSRYVLISPNRERK